jgi:hypothetical protein
VAYYYFQRRGGEETWSVVPASQWDSVAQTAPMFRSALWVDKVVEEVPPDQHDKLCYHGPFYIDFDGPDIDFVIGQVREFCAKLQAMGLDMDSVAYYATGSKGFHIEVAPECFMESVSKKGVQLLPVIYKEMVMGLYVDTIDLRVYSARRGRMWRQPGVMRDNGRCKVPLTFTEVTLLDAVQYAVLTSTPREPVVLTKPVYNVDLGVAFAKAKQKVEDTIKQRGKRKKDPLAKERAGCTSIKMMMSNMGVKPGTGFHEMAIQIAISATTAGMSEEEMLADCALLIETHQGNGNRYNTPGRRAEELRRMYRYVSDNPLYEFSVPAVKVLLSHPAPDLDGITVSKSDLIEGIAEAQEAADAVAAQDHTIGGEDGTIIPDEYNDVAGGVTLSRFGVYVPVEEGGKRRICALSFDDIHLLISMDTGQMVAYEAEVLVNGRKTGRQTIEAEVFQSAMMFNRFCQKYGHAMQGTEAHLRGLFMRFVEKAKKKGRMRYIAKREGLDILNIPNHDDPELREPFLVWADSRDVILEPRVRDKGLDVSFQGYPDPRGLFKTDLADSPKLIEWIKDPLNKVAMKNTLVNMMTCQKADVMSKLIGWYTACFYRTLFHKAYNKFPLLHVNGAAGAGKSEMNKVMCSLFYYHQEPKMLTPQSTPFAIAQHASSSASIPLILDEYKPVDMGFDLHNRLKLLFRDAYNGRDVMKGGGNRESDDYRSLTHTQLMAPMAFIAEAAEEESAVAERVVLCTIVKPPSSVSLKWLARFQAWDRNKQHLAILGQYIAGEAVNTASIDGLRKEFDTIFEAARNRFMLTEADLLAGLDEKTMAEKQGAKERSVFNFTVALFGLRRFRRVVDMVFGPQEFAELFTDLEDGVYTRMNDLQPATQAEWAKVLDTFATMTYGVDGESPYALRPGREYRTGQAGGRNVVELAIQDCYMKYRGYMRSTSSRPLFSGVQQFLHSMKDCPALVGSGFGTMLERPGVYMFDTDELAKMKVSQFKS